MALRSKSAAVTTQVSCASCAVGQFSYPKLRGDISQLQNTNTILNEHFSRARYVNQLNEIRNRFLEKAIHSSKQAAVKLKNKMETQRVDYEVEKRDHALVLQSFHQQSARLEAAEKDLKHERAISQYLTGCLSQLEAQPRRGFEINMFEKMSADGTFREWKSTASALEIEKLKSMKAQAEVTTLRKELQLKTEKEVEVDTAMALFLLSAV